jgi:hypothetical protein
MSIDIIIKGAEKIVAALDKFPEEIKKNFSQAADEAGKEIINTRGIGAYPPLSDANRPPAPYYVRGTGMQYKSKNDGRSERYGTRFYVKRRDYGAVIGNSASYATYLTGDKATGSPHEQAQHMAKLGWRKLVDVAKEKIDVITGIYNRWAEYTIRKLGL